MVKANLACLITGVFLMLTYFLAAQENVIHAEIGGLRNDKGKVMCALFSSAGDFPKRADKAVMRSAATIAGPRGSSERYRVAATSCRRMAASRVQPPKRATSDDSDMPTAAAAGVTKPSAAAGTATAL